MQSTPTEGIPKLGDPPVACNSWTGCKNTRSLLLHWSHHQLLTSWWSWQRSEKVPVSHHSHKFHESKKCLNEPRRIDTEVTKWVTMSLLASVLQPYLSWHPKELLMGETTRIAAKSSSLFTYFPWQFIHSWSLQLYTYFHTGHSATLPVTIFWLIWLLLFYTGGIWV